MALMLGSCCLSFLFLLALSTYLTPVSLSVLGAFVLVENVHLVFLLFVNIIVL